jgi:hypothetical protein
MYHVACLYLDLYLICLPLDLKCYQHKIYSVGSRILLHTHRHVLCLSCYIICQISYFLHSSVNVLMVYTGCVTESGDFKNVMNNKLLHLFGFNTYKYSIDIKALRFSQFNSLKTEVYFPKITCRMTTTPL